METLQKEKVYNAVKEHYGKIASGKSDGCCSTSCCNENEKPESDCMGYSEEEISSVPAGSDLRLGCGNPLAIASLKEGDIVLDLGSGAGFDCFLAANQVGEEGFVIGIDMTSEMLGKARLNAEKGDYKNVEFRLGEIENLPIGDNSIDVIISNCVINLSPDKQRVFNEVFRVLKPGGRIAVSDIVTTAKLPEEIQNNLSLYAGCVAGALSINELEEILLKTGFENIKIQSKDESKEFIREWIKGKKLDEYIVSATIEALKPVN